MSPIEAIASLMLFQVQLRDAVAREDYDDASKFKYAISAAEKNDTVGSAMSYLRRAIEEELYKMQLSFETMLVWDWLGCGLVFQKTLLIPMAELCTLAQNMGNTWQKVIVPDC